MPPEVSALNGLSELVEGWLKSLYPDNYQSSSKNMLLKKKVKNANSGVAGGNTVYHYVNSFVPLSLQPV